MSVALTDERIATRLAHVDEGGVWEFPACVVFTFDETDRLEAETVYYDRITVLAQLGVM